MYLLLNDTGRIDRWYIVQGFPGGTQGRKELDMTEVTQCTHTHTHTHTHVLPRLKCLLSAHLQKKFAESCVLTHGTLDLGGVFAVFCLWLCHRPGKVKCLIVVLIDF